MPGVGDEPALAFERGLEPAQHGIERVGQLTQFVTRPAQRYAGGQVVLGGFTGGAGDLVDRPQNPAGDEPPGERGQQRGYRERDQGVLQQVRQGRFPLVLGALPERLFYGGLPLFRQLHTGDTGADVKEVEENLAALGYTGFTVDQTYTAATASMVRKWQHDTSLTQTGVFDPADVVRAPAQMRVTALPAHLGDPANGPILTYTGTTRMVRIALDVALQGLVKQGITATVTLPDRKTVNGTVGTVGAVATRRPNGQRPGDDRGDGHPRRPGRAGHPRPGTGRGQAGLGKRGQRADRSGRRARRPRRGRLRRAGRDRFHQPLRPSPARYVRRRAGADHRRGHHRGHPRGGTVMIILERVGKTYPGGVEALRDVSLTIEPGEMVGIVGPSGSGKSTMLHLIGALDLPTTGSVTIADQQLSRLSDRQLSALRGRTIGFVFQQFSPRRGRTRPGQRRRRPALRRSPATTAATPRRAGIDAGRARPPPDPPPSPALRRRETTRRRRPRGRRRPGPAARRRTDRKPRLRVRRRGHAPAPRTAHGRHHDRHHHPQP